jgi:hypothetical protein
MNIVFLIIGLIVIYILWTIALNQKVICKNQVQQTKLLLEQFNKKRKK